MSRILPINKSLDDRYINQDEKITEQALTQLIDNPGGGGGASYVVSRNGFALYPDGQVFSTKAEACVSAGISESDWDALISGELIADLVIDHVSSKRKYPYYEYEGDLDLKRVAWDSGQVNITTSEKLYFVIAERDGQYFVAGINKDR